MKKLLLALLCCASLAQAQTMQELLNDGKNTDNALTYGTGHDHKRYSPLRQINTSNVKRLVPAWNSSMSNLLGEQAQPLVHDGVMFVTNAAWTFAIDVATGRQLWRHEVNYDPSTPRVVCCGVSNKGAAIFNGKLYRTTLDTHVLALDMKTGEIVWHYQYTPDDTYDYDAVNEHIIADIRIDGQMRKVLLHADRNGFFYVLDRANGQLVRAFPFGKVNWATYIDMKTGRPAETDVRKRLLAGEEVELWPAYGAKIKWRVPIPQYPTQAGMLATDGGLVFTGRMTGEFIAFDERDGKILWQFQTGSGVNAPPITYTHKGVQYITVLSGIAGDSRGRRARATVPAGGSVWTFALMPE